MYHFFFFVNGRYRYTDDSIEKSVYSFFSTLPLFEREGISRLKQSSVSKRERERDIFGLHKHSAIRDERMNKIYIECARQSIGENFVHKGGNSDGKDKSRVNRQYLIFT
jgi:hypothetical protein